MLEEFGPSKVNRPEYPFWHLQEKGVWELEFADQSDRVRDWGGRSPTDAELRRNDAVGGFPEPVHTLLSRDPSLIRRAAEILLTEHFPSTYHEELLSELGFDLADEGEWVLRTPRDPHFRGKVLLAYEHRCAICGFDLRMDSVPVGLDAAHIRWKQANGPDSESNGLALCTLHHRLFDRGAFTVTSEHRTLVSRHVLGEALEEWLLRFHGGEIRPAQEPSLAPAAEHLDWHAREVFRRPARGAP